MFLLVNILNLYNNIKLCHQVVEFHSYIKTVILILN